MKKHSIIFLLILSLFCFASQGQNNKIDSLKIELVNSISDSVSSNLLIEISKLHLVHNSDSALFYLKKARTIVEKKYMKSNWELGTICDIFYFEGIAYFQKSNFPEAIKQFEIAVENYSQLINKNDSIANSKIYNKFSQLLVSYGLVYTTTGDFNKALDKYYKALAINEKINNTRGMADCLLGIGNLEYHQKDYDKAILTIKKANELYKKANLKKGMANTYNTLGGLYTFKDDFEIAIDYFKKSLVLHQELNNKQGISTAYTNLASVYMNIKEYELAIDYYTKALAIDEELEDYYGSTITRANIAQLYNEMGNNKDIDKEVRFTHLNNAYAFSRKAYDDACILKATPLVNNIAELLIKICKSLGKYEDALNYSSVFIATKDSMFNDEKTRALAEMQTRFETEKQLQQIDSLNNDKSKQRIIIFIVLLGFFIILLFSTFLYRLFVQKKNANILLESQKHQIELQNSNLQQANEEISSQRDLVVRQNQQLETANNHITDSLRYAQSIQAAILPSEKVLTQISTDFFIMMKPCELVSGDFFWATTFEEFQIFCIADCTGHGVPGAFMSILGITALNDIVARHRVTKPSEILGYLRQSVIDTLNQNNPDQFHKDGLDIALCVFNTKNRELQFAGAGIPLWLVTNEPLQPENDKFDSEPLAFNDYKMYELKADIMPVGHSPRMLPFKNRSIRMPNHKTNLYLSTDGFGDQFGGAKKTKYGVAQLKQFIIQNANTTATKQKQLLELEFEQWKGTGYQIDDVAILGISV